MNFKPAKEFSRHADNGSSVEQITRSFPLEVDTTMAVETEMMIVDRRTGQPIPLFRKIARALSPDLQARVRSKPFACQIGYVTGQHATLRPLFDELQNFAKAIPIAARHFGAKVQWSGIHPNWPVDPAIIREGESAAVLISDPEIISRMPTCSVRFHITVNRDKAIQIVDDLQRFVPFLVALSANSPLVANRPSGFQGLRAEVLSNGIEVCGLSHPYGDWNGFERRVADLTETGRIKCAEDLQYFVRPTQFGTIEIGCCDLPMNFEQIVALATVIWLLVDALQNGFPVVPLEHDILNVELRRATKNGIDAVLTDHAGREGTVLDFLNRLRYDLEATARKWNLESSLGMLTSVLAKSGSKQQLREHQNSLEGVRTRQEIPQKRERLQRLRQVAAAAVAASVFAIAMWIALY